MKFPSLGWLAGLCIAGGVMIPMAGADIRNTPHNLAKSNSGETSADDTCVFCHTPRISLSESGVSAGGQIAAWQRSLSRDFSFTAVDPVSSQLQMGDGPLSLICLSCHDGNQAPFEGGMHQNHPVGVPFRGWKRPGTKKDASGFAIPMQTEVVPEAPAQPAAAAKAEDGYSTAGAAQMGENMVWWVSATGAPRRQRGDLPLYGRVMPDGERVPNVECSSCHDPHNTSTMFLRMSNGGSRLCLTCHTI